MKTGSQLLGVTTNYQESAKRIKMRLGKGKGALVKALWFFEMSGEPFASGGVLTMRVIPRDDYRAKTWAANLAYEHFIEDPEAIGQWAIFCLDPAGTSTDRSIGQFPFMQKLEVPVIVVSDCTLVTWGVNMNSDPNVGCILEYDIIDVSVKDRIKAVYGYVGKRQ